MGWIETSIQLLTSRVEYLFRLLTELQNQLRAVQQGLQSAFQQWTTPDSGGDGAPYYADHLNIAGISGLLSASPVPHSATGVSVYRLAGGSFVLVTSSGTVINPFPDATDSTKRQKLSKNADGTYAVDTQSCTAP